MTAFSRAALLLLLCLTAFAAAWTKEDHEIFRLNDEFQASEGKNVTFYSFLGIKPNSNHTTINAAYKRLSRQLHPDKARSQWLARYNAAPKLAGAKPTVVTRKDKKPSQSELDQFNKEATARFERLALVVNILRGPERDRYDHFLNNGFPVWRGTGYYYQRFRPGLGSVLFGLFVFGGGVVHYAALYVSWKRQREFVQRYISQARRAAWGEASDIASIPGLGRNLGTPTASGSGTSTPGESEESMQWNRKQKRAMEKEKRKDAKKPAKGKPEPAKNVEISAPTDAHIISGPVGAKKRTRAENGKILIVDSVGNVYLEDETEEGEVHEFLLDPDEIAQPSLMDTFLVRAPIFLYNQSLGRLLNKQTTEEVVWEANGAPLSETLEGAPISLDAAISTNANAEARKRRTKAKP
ncbi:hypothetical protein AMS68_005577 [Peltaster fructicola]|uniref:J domain-containing protein n=1 Tax=Peltaster fructicola TaxID=286661 RepID=A0A6H0Y086_9PEZI|nr:hypothetical protein AMS68_005577 [Peltaster fructicola]